MGKRIAKALDSAAAKMHNAGTSTAGSLGGRAADAVANKVIAPIRSVQNVGCTGQGAGCTKKCKH
ncbi:hypothetical protein ACIBAC_00135 [Streptomyces sp. NPDC051362]|uniref:hypothetical protein n=1 Tax=Streptomyces sp. NPDC051362 TaxID=3365651 RepID=UPI0037B40FF5